VSACNLTDEDKNRIDDAENNLQKVALDPKITQPSDQEMVSGVVQVVVDVDDSNARVEYEKVTLLIGPEVVATDFEAPYVFDVDTYFLAGQEKVTLLAKAYTVDGNLLRSDVVNIIVDSNAGSSLGILSPSFGESFEKSDDIDVVWTEIPSAASYEYQLNGGDVVETSESSVQLSFDEISKHSIKVRAINEDGDAGVWSSEVEFATGLFAYAFDIKRYSGYSSYDRNDRPVDFLITDDEFALLAAGSDQYSDGSGDSYETNVASITNDGELNWHRSYSSYKNPTAFTKTTGGYLVTSDVHDWYDSAIFETDQYGYVQWSHLKEGVERVGSDPYSYEEIGAAVELDENNILLSRWLKNYEQYKDDPTDSYWRSRLINSQLSFEVIDKNTNDITETVVEQPVGGEYRDVSHFLITETDIKAVGKFELDSGGNDGSADSYSSINPNGSGAVVFSLSNSGVLDDSKTKTGGGPSNTYIKDVVERANGNLLVGFSGYDRSGATEFNSALTYNDYSNALGIRYGRVATHSTENEYIVAGEANSQYSSPEILKYKSNGTIQRISLYGFSNDLSIKAIKHDERYGYVFLATDEGALNFSNGSYTVIFNMSDDNETMFPTELISH
jgi:hypothetical protein